MCDCRLQWVESYMKMVKSHQFSRELRDLQCKSDGENETLQTVHLMKMECDKFTTVKQRNLITTSRSVTQPVNLVPYEIHGRRNKTRKTAVMTEDTTVVQDSEAEELADEMEDSDSKSNRSVAAAGDICLITFVTLWTLFLVRKREET